MINWMAKHLHPESDNTNNPRNLKTNILTAQPLQKFILFRRQKLEGGRVKWHCSSRLSEQTHPIFFFSKENEKKPTKLCLPYPIFSNFDAAVLKAF